MVVVVVVIVVSLQPLGYREVWSDTSSSSTLKGAFFCTARAVVLSSISKGPFPHYIGHYYIYLKGFFYNI